MRKIWKPVAGLFCGVSMASIAGTGYAQDQDSRDDDEVIIVTATLRAADVQDVPIAVTAISPVQLERQGVQDIRNIGQISSSFSLQSSQTESQGTSIRIRGVGTTGNNIGLESSVGVFIDGVYQSRPGVALGDLVDLERLEVLRGPQGTLFGRNTSAGALNISTKKPNLTEAEGYVNASYGNYNFFNIQAGISVPIVKDSAGLRVSGAYRKRDGLLNSITTGAESANRDRFLLRGQLLFEPAPEVSIRLIADYQQSYEECCDAVVVRETELVGLGAFAAYGLPANGGVPASGNNALENRISNSQQFRNPFKQYGFSGELKWDLGPAQLTYIGSYRDFHASSVQESDFVGLNLFSTGQGSTAAANASPTFDDVKTWTQELRFQGNLFDDRLDWLLGAYYSDEKIVEDATLTLGSDYQRAAATVLFPAIGLAFGPNPLLALTSFGNGGVPVSATGNFARNLFKQDATSFSVFTHNVFTLSEGLDFTFGARYVDEKKDGSFDQLAANSPACAAISNAIVSGAFTAIGLPTALQNAAFGLTCFPFSTDANSPLNAALPLPREFNQTFKDDELTYTLQLSYKPTDDLLLYGGFSHGFKSGGFNLDPAAAAGGESPQFRSEKVDSYEVGIKSEFLDKRIRANLALFHMDLSDFQVLEFTGIQFQTFNVNGAKSTGAELEIFGKLADNLTADVALTYVDARYPGNCADGITGSALPTVQRLCGGKLTNAPTFTGILGLTYDGPVGGSEWSLLANVNLRHETKRRTGTVPLDSDNLPFPFDFQKANTKVNARLGVTLPGDQFTIEAFATNLFDVQTRSITFNVPLRGGAGTRSRGAFIDDPRTYGVTVRAKF